MINSFIQVNSSFIEFLHLNSDDVIKVKPQHGQETDGLVEENDMTPNMYTIYICRGTNFPPYSINYGC